MSYQTKSLTGGAAGMIDYFRPLAEFEFSYYADTEDGPGADETTDDTLIFPGSKVSGRAAARMGFGIEMGIHRDATAADMRAVAEGRHAGTGEVLTRQRRAPVYEKDASGRYRLDDDGAKIRRLDRAGKPMMKDASLIGIDVTLSAPKEVSIFAAVAAGLNPRLGRDVVQAQDRAAAKTMAKLESLAKVGKRSVQTPSEVRELVGAGAPVLVTKGARVGKPTRTQGSRTERVPLDLAVFSVTQHTARPTAATNDRGAPPDMSLHTHNLIARSGWDPVTESWRTIDEYALKEGYAAEAFDATYLGHLHDELRDLGVPMEYGDFNDAKHGRMPWRIAGITEEAVAFYSSNANRKEALVAAWEEEHGRVASPAMVNKLMHDTKLTKDHAAKMQDQAPDHRLWLDDAARHGIELATPELVQRIERPRSQELRPYADRHEELWARLNGPNGLTMRAATFDAHRAGSALSRCAEGLGFTPEEMDHLAGEVLDMTVPLGPHRDQRDAGVKRTTLDHWDRETRVSTALLLKDAAPYAGATTATIDAELANLSTQLDPEQIDLVRAVASGRGLVFIEGHAGSGKTTALRPAIAALRRDGAIDHVIVVSTASRTAQDSGRKLGAEASGSIESITHRIATGRLKVDAATLVVVDESYMVDTARMDALLAEIGPARLVLAGDDHQAQPIGPSGWYHDALVEHGLHPERLEEVHRHDNPQDAVAYRAIREDRADAALADLSDRGRIHLSEDAQGTFDQVAMDYRAHRDTGLEAPEVTVMTDRSNHDVDAMNRLIQHDRVRHGEIAPAGFAVEATSAGRRWQLHAGDPVIFLRPYKTDSGVIPNGTSGEVVALDPSTGTTSVRLEDATVVKVSLQRRAETQPLAPAYALHVQKFQGGERPVVLYLPAAPERLDKFRSYSALTRATQEAHVYLDHETHGERAVENVADALRAGTFAVSARATARLGNAAAERAVAPVAPPRTEVSRSDLYAAKVDARLQRLRSVVGPEITQAVRDAPALPALVARLDRLDRTGARGDAMLRRAARSRSLDDAHDPAAVLLSRLNREPRVSRVESHRRGPSQSLVPDRSPQVPGRRSTSQLLRANARQRDRGPSLGIHMDL